MNYSQLYILIILLLFSQRSIEFQIIKANTNELHYIMV